ncbi:MAG TPA: hypothetical protein VNM14_11185 [Planctomycetota bacterium]|nr:hypothetical protein [Planctomycetota bacterium]
MGRIAGLLALTCLLGAAMPRQTQADLGFNCFPADNPWNWDITGLSVHPGSDTYVSSMGGVSGASAPIREDYSFQYSVVLDAQPNVDITLGIYADESDPGPLFGSPVGSPLSSGDVSKFPFPNGAPIEGGGDAHVLVIDKDNKLLYETYQTSGGPPWTASCSAVFNLNSNALRPDGWTSGDAAGLPIFPGLIRYEEVAAGQISHALRVTCPSTQNKHLYPARHHAGSANTNLPPMGLRLRLKAGTDISGYTGAAKTILNALKKHGLIVADNGSSWYISTTVDTRWSGTNITQIRNMHGSDFEVVTSVDASGNPVLPVGGGGGGPPPPPPPSGGSSSGGGGGGGGGGCGLLGAELLLVWLAARSRPRK